MREKPYSDCLILFSKRRKESITKIFSQKKKLHPFPIKRWNKERTDSNPLTKNLPLLRFGV